MYVVATPVTGQSNTPCADVVSVHRTRDTAITSASYDARQHNIYSVAAMPRGIKTQRVAVGQRLTLVGPREVRPMDLD
jgi:phosphoribosylcarboxyaminoimidazole (NCAIR) mutase